MVDLIICLFVLVILGWFSVVEGLPSSYKMVIIRPFLGNTVLIYNAYLFEKGIYVNDPGHVHIEKTSIFNADTGIRIFTNPYSTPSFFKELAIYNAGIGVQIDSPPGKGHTLNVNNSRLNTF